MNEGKVVDLANVVAVEKFGSAKVVREGVADGVVESLGLGVEVDVDVDLGVDFEAEFGVDHGFDGGEVVETVVDVAVENVAEVDDDVDFDHVDEDAGCHDCCDVDFGLEVDRAVADPSDQAGSWSR